jgi:hypothetical protein
VRATADQPILERLTARTVHVDECWICQRGHCKDGYCQISVDGRLHLVHRMAYELLVGPIPAGLQIDHLCRNKACWNPEHLEPVDGHTNTLRHWATVTHCRHGHEFDEANTRYYQGRRHCRACARRHQRDAQQRRNAA